MKSNWIVVLIVAGIIGLFVVMYFIFLSPILPKYDWAESYLKNDHDPYGTKYFFESFKESQDSTSFTSIDYMIYYELDVTDTNSLYVFIGKKMFADSSDLLTILEFVQNGNTAFISLKEIPVEINDQFREFDYLIGSYLSDSIVDVRFLNDTTAKPFQFYFQKYALKAKYLWRYFDINFDSAQKIPNNLTPLSFLNNDECDFLAVKYGKGVFYFHANPIMFSNYYFIKNEGLRYVNTCFESINPNKIYWDESSKIPYPDRGYSESDESILRYIFTQPGLKWAWYLMLSGFLLFIIFKSKRTQRVVPLLPYNTNSSKEFVKSVALLYQKTDNHQVIAAEMMKLFLQFVKIKYGVSIKLDSIQKAVSELSAISGIDAETLNLIFVLNLEIGQQTQKQNEHLKKLHASIENFYKNCK